jgi:hypothetical protein
VWAVELIKPVVGEFDGLSHVEVVDFVGDNVLGQFRDGRVLVARKVLASDTELIATLVHEVAHHYGCDGSVDHRDAIDCIFASIVVKLSGREDSE